MALHVLLHILNNYCKQIVAELIYEVRVQVRDQLSPVKYINRYGPERMPTRVGRQSAITLVFEVIIVVLG